MERAELEMLRAREAEMEAHFSEQSERMAHSEREAQAQQAVTAQMRAEWEAMKAEVRAPFASAAHPSCSFPWEAGRSEIRSGAL